MRKSIKYFTRAGCSILAIMILLGFPSNMVVLALGIVSTLVILFVGEIASN